MTPEAKRILVFSLHDEEFALELQDVVEVVEPPVVFPIPRTPAYILGAMNFHGALLPIIDLARYANSGTCVADGKLLVLDSRIANLAIWVDSVKTIVSVDTIEGEKAGEDDLTRKVLFINSKEIKLLALENLVRTIELSINSK
jgi:purine-binding chemotaxis protein CheW